MHMTISHAYVIYSDFPLCNLSYLKHTDQENENYEQYNSNVM